MPGVAYEAYDQPLMYFLKSCCTSSMLSKLGVPSGMQPQDESQELIRHGTVYEARFGQQQYRKDPPQSG